MDNNRRQFPDDLQTQDAREDDCKNLETFVNNPSYFNVAYELKAEDEMVEEESRTEEEGRSGKKGRNRYR